MGLLMVTVTILKDYLIVAITIFKKYLIVTIVFPGGVLIQCGLDIMKGKVSNGIFFTLIPSQAAIAQ